MIKLVIFDLDGTLINSLDDIANAGNYILSKHGFPTHSVNAYKKFVGNGVIKLIERIIPENYRNKNFILQLTDEFSLYYSEHSEVYTKPYAGIKELLEWLLKNSIRIAVASNKNDADTKFLIKQYFPEINFAAVYGRREGVPTKPNPAIILNIMEELKIKSKEKILYVGDSDVDMKTANAAGVFGIGVEWGFRTSEELLTTGADIVINSPKDLKSVIEDKNKI